MLIHCIKLVETFEALRTLFTSDIKDVSKNEKKLANKLSELSTFLQIFRTHGLQVGEMSRISQYISKIGGGIEQMKVILKYRTPVTLRAYSKVFIYSFPVLYGPYFVFVSHSRWLIRQRRTLPTELPRNNLEAGYIVN